MSRRTRRSGIGDPGPRGRRTGWGMTTRTGWARTDGHSGRRPLHGSPAHGFGWLAWPAVLLWVLVVVRTPSTTTLTHHDLAVLARNLAAPLLLVAGVLQLAVWRLTAAPQVARQSVAWVLLSAGIPGAAAIGPLLGEPATFAHAAPSTRTLFLIPVVLLLLPGATWARQSFAQPIPLRYLVILGWAVGLAVGVAVFARESLRADALPTTWRLLCCGSALAWLLLAYRTSTAPKGAGAPAGSRLVPVYLLFAAAELFRLFAVGGDGAVLGVAPGVQLAAAGLLVAASVRDLGAAHDDEQQCAAELARTVDQLQRDLATVEQAQRERLHDARSAVSGVIGATELLGATAPVRAIDPDRLHRLIDAELHRLRGLLDVGPAEAVGEFDLAAAVEPVVLSHQLDRAGLAPLCVSLTPVRVVGRPDATVTALDNLLRNARVHAPHAHISVCVQSGPDAATVVVDDDGPGIPDAERPHVVRRGVRGSSPGGPGEGLGLHTSLTAMLSQGGSLRLEGRPGGGTRAVLTLPLAPPRVIDLPARELARGA